MEIIIAESSFELSVGCLRTRFGVYCESLCRSQFAIRYSYQGIATLRKSSRSPPSSNFSFASFRLSQALSAFNLGRSGRSIERFEVQSEAE